MAVCTLYFINYLLGKYGFYIALSKLGLNKSIDKAQKKLQRHAFVTIMFSYWEPNLASITATAAGIIRLNLKKFFLYSAIGIVIWNIFWGVLVFSLGEAALELATSLIYVIIIFVIWVTVILAKYYLWDKRKMVGS